VIFADEPAEYWMFLDRYSQIDHPVWPAVRCLQVAALVRAMAVVVRLPIGEYTPWVPFADDQEMI
jgi:hypothetical protein